jgi:hypothetical protein
VPLYLIIDRISNSCGFTINLTIAVYITLYKISTVSDHEKSCVHTDAVRVIESQKQALTQQTRAHKTVMALKEQM